MLWVLSLQAMDEKKKARKGKNKKSAISASFCSTISIFGLGCGKSKEGFNLRSSASIKCTRD